MDDKTKQVRLSDLPRLWLRNAGKDGQSSYEDVMSVADNIIKIGGLNGKAANNLYAYWNDTFLSTERHVPNYFTNPFIEQVLAVWAMANDPEKKKPWVSVYGKIFEAIDFNSDGFISFDEYLILWKALEFDPSQARLQFDYMDTNHDWKISEKEFVDAYDDFAFNTDVIDNGNRFCGPLLDF